MGKKLSGLVKYLEDKGLKNTRQRETVAQVFFSTPGHISAEELYNKVSKVDPDIGLTTVYRTLKLMKEAGLVKERRFHNTGVFEKEDGSKHHDHLICTRCGRIIEFKEPTIEKMQDEVARKYGFSVEDHKLELYGLCRGCASA